MPKIEGGVKRESAPGDEEHTKKAKTEHAKLQAAIKTEDGADRIKSEEIKSEEIKSEEIKSEAALKTEDEQESTLIVEFKFRSCETACIDEGEMTGVLRVPMLQDAHSSRFRVPDGISTKATGMVQRVRWLKEITEEHITASFERKPGGPIENFKLGYDLEYEHGETVSTWVVPSTSEREDEDHLRRPFQIYPHYYKAEMEKDLYRQRLNDWEKNAGGMLQLFAEAHLISMDCVSE
jgi:hypothetical protein